MKLFFLLLVQCSTTLASVPTHSIEERVANALREPHALALNAIKAMGPASAIPLESMAFNEKWPMKTRWKAFMLLTEFQGSQSLQAIKKALLSPTWYMRSAGMMAMNKVDELAAKKWAYKFLAEDKALMVRMKAVEILQNDNSEKVTELFWKKVYSSDSLHRQKSLWIRGDLAQVLAKNPRQKDLGRWVALLHQPDQKLQMIASVALNKLHSRDFEKPIDVGSWQKKYPSKSL